MKDTYKQKNLPGVPEAKQGREVAPQWAWTEASVWTERMLATLERGIKGNKWYSLIDKSCANDTSSADVLGGETINAGQMITSRYAG